MTQEYAMERNSAALKADIERTRNDMSHKIDRISQRVSPEYLKDQAQDAMRTAMNEGADTVVNYVRDHAADLGSTLFDAVKHNPVPVALIGLGVGWLLVEGLSEQSGGNRRHRHHSPYNYNTQGYGYEDHLGGADFNTQRGYTANAFSANAPQRTQGSYTEENGGFVNQVRHRAEDLVNTVGDKVEQMTDAVSERTGQVTDKVQQWGNQVSHMGEQTRHQAQHGVGQVQHLAESNPLSLGLAALAVGVAVGLALPATRRESQIMGPWRDQAMEKAQSMTQDVKQRVQEVVEEAKPELQQIAAKVVEDVKHTGKEAVSGAKEAVQKASQPAQA